MLSGELEKGELFASPALQRIRPKRRIAEREHWTLRRRTFELPVDSVKTPEPTAIGLRELNKARRTVLNHVGTTEAVDPQAAS